MALLAQFQSEEFEGKVTCIACVRFVCGLMIALDCSRAINLPTLSRQKIMSFRDVAQAFGSARSEVH